MKFNSPPPVFLPKSISAGFSNKAARADHTHASVGTFPKDRIVYLVSTASDQSRLGGVSENAYITFQDAYDAADTLTGGTDRVMLWVWPGTAVEYGDVTLAADWNPLVELWGHSDGTLCQLGNIDGTAGPYEVDLRANSVTIGDVNTFKSFGTTKPITVVGNGLGAVTLGTLNTAGTAATATGSAINVTDATIYGALSGTGDITVAGDITTTRCLVGAGGISTRGFNTAGDAVLTDTTVTGVVDTTSVDGVVGGDVVALRSDCSTITFGAVNGITCGNLIANDSRFRGNIDIIHGGGTIHGCVLSTPVGSGTTCIFSLEDSGAIFTDTIIVPDGAGETIAVVFGGFQTIIAHNLVLKKSPASGVMAASEGSFIVSPSLTILP